MTDPMRKILIVEDEAVIRKAIRMACEKEGYEVIEAENGNEGLRQSDAGHPDLILLDLMLPDISGFDVCREIRKSGSRIPIVILSAKTEEIDIVVGLEIGADDYITKPFRARELLARVAAHLRRSRDEDQGADGRLNFKDLAINLNERRVFRGEQEVELTHTEFDLLAFLASNAGKVLSPREDPQPRLGLRVPDRDARHRRPRAQPAPEDRGGPRPALLHPRRARDRLPLHLLRGHRLSRASEGGLAPTAFRWRCWRGCPSDAHVAAAAVRCSDLRGPALSCAARTEGAPPVALRGPGDRARGLRVPGLGGVPLPVRQRAALCPSRSDGLPVRTPPGGTPLMTRHDGSSRW